MKTTKISHFYLSIIVLTLVSCKQAFDKRKWIDGDPVDYSNRDKMVDDLLERYKIVGMQYRTVVDLLGKPSYSDRLQFSYTISEEYNGIDPVYAKDLKISLNRDSIVTKVAITECHK